MWTLALWRRLEAQLALVLACSLLLAFGVWLRAVNLHRPASFAFDEVHFVENARNYLAGRRDWNDHPPLGKLIIDLGILSAGDRSLGWRLPSLVAGLGSVAAAGLLAFRLSRSRVAALVAAGLAAADGFMIAYSRAALLDGFVTFFYLLALIAATYTSWAGVLASAACAGLMAGTKLSGIVCILPLGFVLLAHHCDRRWLRALAAAAVFGSVYVAQYALGLYLAGQPHGPAAVAEETLRLVRHHSALTDMKHWATSGWSTWLLPLKPITLWQSADGASIRMVTSLGNPAIWWAATCAVLWLGARVVRRGAAAVPRPVVFCLIAYVAPLLPWILTKRDSYIYHYLPAYSVAIVLLGLLAANVYRRRRLVTLCAVSSIGVIAAWYAPVWAGLPLAESGLSARLFLPSWR